MRQLVDQVKGNPDAVASLKRIFVDYIVQRHASAVPSRDGYDMMKAANFRSWIERYNGPLKVLFGGQGVQNLQMVAADLRRQAAGPTALAGSQTAPHLARAARTGVDGQGGHANQTLLALLGEHLGSALHGAGGMVGAVIGAVGGSKWNALKQAAIHTKDDLTSFAMLHPEVAKTLMERVDTQRATSEATQKRVGNAIRAAVLADLSSGGERKQ